MDLQRIASRVAILFGQPSKYFKEYTVTVDPNSLISEPGFFLDGKYSEAWAKGEHIADVQITFPDNSLQGAPDIVDVPTGYEWDKKSPVTKELEDLVQKSEAYKDLLEAIKNPNPGQQGLLSSGKEIQVGEYLDA